jgi:histidyl-tRNA synthetase
MQKIQSIRGMNDILPNESHKWQYLESRIKQITRTYGVQEIRMPILEKSELFHRGVGDGTDIVEKETYSFDDRNQENLTLRPEGTAGCVRALIQHGLIKDQAQKVWYMGPMYRYERPQKGRYRQFYQLGVEYFGISGSVIEAELITLSWRLWNDLKIQEHVLLEINNLGDKSSRVNYAQALVQHFEPIIDQLDEDSQRRLYKNPLRILDSKNKNTQELLNEAPKIDDYLDNESQEQFNQLCEFLISQKIPFRVNPNLVRGLDYYTHTVFEWKTDKLGAQDTICAGGRYDTLTEELGGSSTPAIGFAMGLERILLLLEETNLIPNPAKKVDVCMISLGNQAVWEGVNIAEKLRSACPKLIVSANTSSASFKSQFKKADKLKASMAIIIGDDEMKSKIYGVKYLQERKEQQNLSFVEIVELLQQI